MMAVFLLISQIDLRGYVGYHFGYGTNHQETVMTSVGLASLGFEGKSNSIFGYSLRISFFDILKGSIYASDNKPYLQEAQIFLDHNALRLSLGHQIFSYDDGMFIHDLGNGTDALRLFINNKEFFLISKNIWDKRELLFGSYFPISLNNNWFLKFYGVQSQKSLWTGFRMEFQNRLLAYNFEFVNFWQKRESFSLLLNSKFRGKKNILGVMGFVTSSNWEKPLPYPPIFDNFYNGWTSFGEVMTWVLIPQNFYKEVTSLETKSPVGIFTPNLHNLIVFDINLHTDLSKNLYLRFDNFYYWFSSNPKKFIGVELANNLIVQKKLNTLGLAGGILIPSKEIRRSYLINRFPFFIRVWGIVFFESRFPGMPR